MGVFIIFYYLFWYTLSLKLTRDKMKNYKTKYYNYKKNNDYSLCLIYSIIVVYLNGL